MRFLLLLPLVLTGCSSGQDVVEATLNDYAIAAANQSDLTRFLSGDALESAIESEQLLRELGLKSYGASTFSLTRELGGDRFESCLDVSATSFRDAAGEEVLLERKERQIVNLWIQEGKISDLRLSGEPC
jgi:hypothetical protein